MHKMILKLTATGVLITALLAVVVITQGCDNTAKAPTQTTNPSYTLIVDPTGGHCDETTMETKPSATAEIPDSQPVEQATPEKPTFGQIVQGFFENLFGGDKNESSVTATAPQTTGESTVMSIETMDYKTFRTLSSAEKVAFRNLFVDSNGDVDDEAFVIWYNEAKKAYDDKLEADSATGPFGVG